jgi:hypothetical protein
VTDHTPTPWLAYEGTPAAPSWIDSTDAIICHSVIRIEDARFITLAVNAHDDLLKSLKEYVESENSKAGLSQTEKERLERATMAIKTGEQGVSGFQISRHS